MKTFAYGQQPSDITAADLRLGWIRGVRHLKAASAAGSYWHVHGHLQLLYCIRGEFTYEFKDRPSAVLTSGHAITIPADTPHRHLHAIDPAGHRVELLVAARADRAARLSTIPPTLADRLLADLRKRAFRPFRCNRALAELFETLDRLAERGAGKALAPVDLARARTVLCKILIDCAAPQSADLPRRDETRMMSAALAWLKQHAGERFTVPRLVTYMGYSRSRLFVLFREHTGLTPAAWLTRHRIERARQLLTRTRQPLAEIARTCGFSSANYFATVFRQSTGMTPSAWRLRSGPRSEHPQAALVL